MSDRAPRRSERRSKISIRVYDVDKTKPRDETCVKQTFKRDPDLLEKAPLVWPPCRCPVCREVPA
jgi:hypothetical protein